jgi:glycine cleavage system aminomethyltransferase T
MNENVDSAGVARYPVGNCPILDVNGETLIDSKGRRSYTTSIVFGPSIGKNLALGYLPYEYCQLGQQLEIEYFGDNYKVTVAAVGYGALYDPDNTKPKS